LQRGAIHCVLKSALQGNGLLWAVLALLVARLWLMPLPSSLWVDEMVTVFVVRQGGGHPSLAVAPQVPASLYYWLPALIQRVFGFSEIGYRLPSVLAMGLAVFLVARLAARLIHPQTGWLTAFACFALGGIDYHAADARPYALGMAVAAAAAWFLVRWLDHARWLDGLLFAASAGLLWWVHLVYWPFYGAVALYAVVRFVRRDTPVSPARAAVVFTLLGGALVPVLLHTLRLVGEAQAHVIAEPPSLRVFFNSFQLRLLLICGGGAWLLGRMLRWKPDPFRLSLSSTVLILGWWLSQPLCLYGFSWLSGNSVFVQRYLSLMLPGVALAAVAVAARFIPQNRWKHAALGLGLGVLLIRAQWTTLWPQHDNSDWRSAARAVNQLRLGPGLPLVCPSPFVEARWPVWRPDYPLPGFLYAHLPVYPVAGHPYLFPNETSPEAELYAVSLLHDRLSDCGRFVLYGGAGNVRYWRKWFAARPELVDWHSRSLGEFGDMGAILFQR